MQLQVSREPLDWAGPPRSGAAPVGVHSPCCSLFTPPLIHSFVHSVTFPEPLSGSLCWPGGTSAGERASPTSGGGMAVDRTQLRLHGGDWVWGLPAGLTSRLSVALFWHGTPGEQW